MEDIIKELLAHLGTDKEKIEEFLKNPKKIIDDLHLDVKEDQLEEIVKGVKAKVNTEGLLSKGKELLGDLEHMFKK